MNPSRHMALVAVLVTSGACSEGAWGDREARSSRQPLVLTVARAQLAATSNDEADVDSGAEGLVRAPVDALGVGSWQTATMPPRFEHAAVAHQGFLYVVGGRDDAGALRDEVLVSQLAPDGAPLSFSPSASRLPVPTARHASTVYNGVLYVVGGMDADGRRAAVQFARIRSDGSLGAFGATTPLTDSRAEHQVFGRDGRLYVAGGRTDTGPTAQVLSAPVLAHGALGTWSLMPEPLRRPRESATTVMYRDYVYVAGGVEGTSHTSIVTAARFNAAGEVVGWDDRAALPEPVSSHSAAVYGSALYVSGGRSSTAVSSKVFGAILLGSGVPGTWQQLTPMPIEREKHVLLAHRGRLYAVGGTNASGSVLQDVAWGNIDAAPATTSGTGTLAIRGITANGRSRHCFVPYKGRVFFIGGYEDNGTRSTTADDYDTDAVDVADILPAGYVGTEARMAHRLQNGGRRQHMCFAHEDVLYVYGGLRAGSTHLADVQSAPIAQDGTVGPWTVVTPNMGETWSLAKVVTYGRFVYFVGGSVNGVHSTRVRLAELLPGGGIGPWMDTTALPGVPRRDHAVAVWGGRLFLHGGVDVNDVPVMGMWAADIEADGRLSTWTPVTTSPVHRWGHSLTGINGTLVLVAGYELTGSSAREARADIWAAPVRTDGTVGPWTQHPTLLDNPRLWHASAVHEGLVLISGGLNPANAPLGTSATPLQGIFAVAPHVPSSEGVATRLFDVGAPVTPLSLTVDASMDRTGKVWMRYRPVLSTGALGNEVHAGFVQLGAPIPVSAPGARGMWVRLGLDDTVSGAPRAGGANRDVFQVSLEYDEAAAPVPAGVSLVLQGMVVQGEAAEVSVQLVDASRQAVALAMPVELTVSGPECQIVPTSVTTDESGAASSMLECRGAGSAELCGEIHGSSESCIELDIGIAAAAIMLSLEPDGASLPIAGGKFDVVARVTNASAWPARDLAILVDVEQVELRGASIISIGSLGAGESAQVQITGRRRSAGAARLSATVAQGTRALTSSSVPLDTDRITAQMGCGCAGSPTTLSLGFLVLLSAARRGNRPRRSGPRRSP